MWRTRLFTPVACIASLSVACGGETEPPPTPQTTTLSYTFSAAAPCDALIPKPNDLFADDELHSSASACGLPSDPIEAAIAQVENDDGAALDAPIRLPFEGVTLQEASLTASAAFSLRTGTSSSAPLPAVVLLEQIGSATVASGWKVLDRTVSATETYLEIRAAAPLTAGHRHVVVVTSAVKNARGRGLDAAPATRLLTLGAPVAASGAIDAAAAALLERERLRLTGIVDLLARASPPISGDKIVALQGFTARLGYARLEREVAAYQAGAARNRFMFQVTTVGGDLRPQDVDPLYTAVCPPGRTVPGCYDRVRAFRRGVIKVPRVLDADGHLRPGWSTNAVEMFDVPFLASLPETTPVGGSAVALYVPGHGRSRLDARALANEYSARLGGGVVIAIDLAGMGERTVDPTTGAAALEDLRPNSDNPELVANTPDGIPDRSGDAVFSGEPRALRDGQLASTIELLHVLETLRRKDPFVSQGIEPDGRTVNLVAHGQAAQVVLHAAAFSGSTRTLVFAAGGAGIKELISGGPASLKAGFLAKAPTGVSAANLDEYLSRLEQTVLQSVSVEESGDRVRGRLIRGMPSARVLLNSGERPREVPVAARQRLIAALELPLTRVSQHHGMCDGFFIFTCSAGDQFNWVAGARNQMATFASSGGVTVVAPAP